MARVLGLEKETCGECPGSRVTLTAVTEPPDTPVTWFIDGDEASFPNPATSLDSRIGQKSKLIEARLDDSSKSLTIEGKAADLVLELDPPPTSGRYIITAEPKPPVITATAVGIGGSPSALQWEVTVAVDATFTKELCTPNAPPDILGSLDFSPTDGGQQIVIDFGGLIRGSRLFVSAIGIVNGCPVKAHAGPFRIAGTNPDRSAVEAELPNNALRKIACKESKFRQFNAPADGGTGVCPLFGPGGKVGIMQVDASTPDQIWDWKANIESGVEKFERHLEEARNYPGRVESSSSFRALVDEFNVRREAEELPRLDISVPAFTPKQLKLDAIRGYNGFFGTDRLGFELHEFRIGVDLVNGAEMLRVSNIDELTSTGEAEWEQVPAEDRPATAEQNEPDYVNAVLACGGGGEGEETCHIEILSAPSERSFSPPSETGEEVFRAVVFPPSGGGTIVWDIVHRPKESGNVEFGTQTDVSTGSSILSTIPVKARHPNKAKVRVRVVQDGEVVCSAKKTISVPQFFHIVVFAEGGFFNEALEDLGLRRRPPANGVLTTDQSLTNDQVKAAVIEEIFNTFKFEYESVNVRLTVADPTPVVGLANLATVTCAGLGVGLEFGATPFPDDHNLDPTNSPVIFARRYADLSLAITQEPMYTAIFGGLAVFDPKSGTVLPGKPIDVGEFADPPVTVRQKTVKAAILAYGRLLGTTVAHECGHSLGLVSGTVHNVGRTGELMDAGPLNTFTEKTGIISFDATTGAMLVGTPFIFESTNLGTLHGILPILKA